MDATENITLEQAQAMMAEMSAVNLDEVTAGVVEVAFREFIPDENGGFRIETTMKEIETWVPMFAFNNMLANQKKVQKLRRSLARQVEFATSNDQKDEPKEDLIDLLAEDTVDFATLTNQMFRDIVSQGEPTLLWQAREVLSIWKLTPGEGEMSLKRLMLGLSFEQIQGLFTRFFGAMLQKRTNRA